MYPHKSAKAAMVYVPATLFCLLELGLSSLERVGVFVVPEGNSNPLLFSGDGQLVVTIIVAATITIIVVAIIIRPSCLPHLPTQQFRSTPNPNPEAFKPSCRFWAWGFAGSMGVHGLRFAVGWLKA